MLWRVWKEKGVPLRELREEWTYVDLLQANAILDMDAAWTVAFEALQKEETANDSA